jgi:4-carboxymuconolactone decarboxylase
MDEGSIRKGREILARMTGGRVEELEQRWSALHPDLAELIIGFVAGEIWTRPRLDLKTRSLITVAAMTALGRPRALGLNIRLARGNGASREEIFEVLFQMAAYAGFPACWEGMEIAAQVFAEEGRLDTADE